MLSGNCILGQMSLWANVFLGNLLSGQMSFWANVCWANVVWANVFLGKCLSGQNVVWANVLLGKRRMRKCLWANVSGQMSYGQTSWNRKCQSIHGKLKTTGSVGLGRFQNTHFC
jgi:hypothetical protein